jgi:gluconokinase
MIIILMGVSGCGKTAIGRLLADRLGWRFVDGDDYHPAANRAKISQGIPLTDEDRKVWLSALTGLIQGFLDRGQPVVLACSALKQRYRDQLNIDPDRIDFVYLRGSKNLIQRRLRRRTGHFMKADLLASQFAILEEPEGAIVVDIRMRPARIVDTILVTLMENRSSFLPRSG